MSKIIKPTEARAIVSQEGLKLGLDPRISEQIDQIYKADTSGVIQPLHETERQTNIVDTDFRDGFVTLIMEDSYGNYKGFAERNFCGKTYRVTTPTMADESTCGYELFTRVRMVAKQLKYFENTIN